MTPEPTCRLTGVAAGNRLETAERAQDLVHDLYQQNGTALVAFATRLLGDRHVAEDVVQEAMVRAWRSAEALLDCPTMTRAWMFRVTHNLAVDRLRHQRCRPAEVFVTADAGTEPDRADEVLDAIVLGRALRGLKPAHRRILEEVYLDGRTTADAAAQLGIPVGTARSRLHRARLGLRQVALAAGVT